MPRIEAFKGIMAHFKTKEKKKKTDHVSFTRTGNANFTIHSYEALYMTKVCQYLNIYYTVIKHYINVISSGYGFAEQKVLTAVPLCFHNNHPDT